MKLREILLAGTMLFSSMAFSQDKFKFDIYSKGEGFFNPRINSSSIELSSEEIYFSFLYGIYSMEFKRIDNNTYIESVKNNVPWELKEEIFCYSLKDSCYKLDNYFIIGDEPRKEKKSLEGNFFDKKHKSLPELFDDFEKGLLRDSMHFFVMGIPYSLKIESKKEDGEIVYYCNPEELVKGEPGDFIIFPYPVKAYTKNKDGEIIPLRFATKFLNVRNGRDTNIEGELREED
jgi:hypothetical protein